jgi:hypothetical protein
MTARDDGGPAFPIQGSYDTDYEHNGMSLRDWFAGQALAGILGGGFADTIPHDDINGGRDAAAFAYQYADAVIAERKGGAA